MQGTILTDVDSSSNGTLSFNLKKNLDADPFAHTQSSGAVWGSEF